MTKQRTADGDDIKVRAEWTRSLIGTLLVLLLRVRYYLERQQFDAMTDDTEQLRQSGKPRSSSKHGKRFDLLLQR